VAALKAAKQAGNTVYTQKRGGANALVEVLTAACLASTVAATFSYIVTNVVKEVDRNI
jgi:hypothetical protein